MPTDVLAEAVAAVRAGSRDGSRRARGDRQPDPRPGPEVAATGVDYLSVGALTHSSPILDIALDLVAATDRPVPAEPGPAGWVRAVTR